MAWAATPVPATIVAASAAMATPARLAVNGGGELRAAGLLPTGDGAAGAGLSAGRTARARRTNCPSGIRRCRPRRLRAGFPPLGLITSSASPASIRRPPRTISGTAHGVEVSLGNVMEMDDGAGLVPSEASSSDHSPSAGAFHV